MSAGAASTAASGIELGTGRIDLVRQAGEHLLVLPASLAGFSGREVEREGRAVRLVRPTAGAAARLRELAPTLRPRPLGTGRSSFGFGDRIGLATPGHVRALRDADACLAPIFAQQSARELERTGRTFREVLDAAMWGALTSGWTAGYGADADHLRTAKEVADAVAAGFTMLTLDSSARIDADAVSVDGTTLERRVCALPWAELEDTWAAVRRRYAGVVTDELELARAAAIFGHALARVVALWRVADARRSGVVDVEVAVDETPVPTSVFAHRYLARELERLGVPVTSLAPRFPGGWQKGVEVAGDLSKLAQSLRAHARVAAEEGGHKLGVHSGSDKFTLYPLIAEGGECRWHVKTSGTSYLEALRTVAVVDPDLFREILFCTRTRFGVDRHTYEVAATAAVPEPAGLLDDELPAVLDDPDARQGLHVTFGSVLGEATLARRLRFTLTAHADRYEDLLAEHLGRHLDPLRALG